MDVKEVAELKAKLQQEHNKDIEAIDRVLSLLDKNGITESTLPPSAPQTEAQEESGANEFSLSSPQDKADDKTKEKKFVPQVRQAVRDLKHLLPMRFTKHDAGKILLENKPEYKGHINDNPLSLAMAALVDDGFAKLVEKSRGRKAAIYERIIENVAA